MRLLLTLALFPLLSLTVLSENLLKNPGFESRLDGWEVAPVDAKGARVCPEAASMGKWGLRLGPGEGNVTVSSTESATPGQIFRLACWARSGGGTTRGSVGLAFWDASGKQLHPVSTVRGLWPGAEIKSGAVECYVCQAAAPEGTVRVAAQLKGTLGGDGYIDVDDLSLEAVSADKSGRDVIPPPVDVGPLLAEAKDDPFRGKAAPKIVVKVDDLKATKGVAVHPKWQKLVDFVNEKRIKAGIGIICDSLEEDNPPYFQWIRDQAAGGRIEFWNHGYDHAEWKEGDKKVMEFAGSTLEHQGDDFTKAITLMKQKCGLDLQSFGAPFNATDASTERVLQADPVTKVWLYGNAAKPAGKTVLQRVYCVNIEYPTFHPRFDKFLEGYVHNRGLAYFVIQGHPTHWDDAMWQEFVKIVEFLQGQGAEFVRPIDLLGAPPLFGKGGEQEEQKGSN